MLTRGTDVSSNSSVSNVIPSEPAKLLLDESSADQSNEISIVENLETCVGSEVVGVEQDLTDIKLSSHFNQEDLCGPDNDMDTNYNIYSVDLTDTHCNENTLLDPNSSLQELLSNPSPGRLLCS